MTAFELMVKLGTLDACLDVVLEISGDEFAQVAQRQEPSQAFLEMVTVETRDGVERVYLWGNEEHGLLALAKAERPQP